MELALQDNNNGIQVDKFRIAGDDNEYVLVRVVEYMLYETTRSTGSFAKALRKHDLPPTLAMSDKTYADSGATKETFDAMKCAYRVFYSMVEPTQVKAPTRFAIVSVESVATIARARHDHRLLEVLGCPIPEEWLLADQSRQLAESNLVDLVLEDQLDEIRETAALELSAELASYEPFESNPEDDGKVETYTLRQPGRHLNTQLQHFIQYQTATLQWMREGGAVGQTTAAADASNFLRFAGWRVGTSCDKMQCFSELLTLVPQDIQDFCTFLVVTRRVRHSTVANYLNSLLNVLSYVDAHASHLSLLLGAPVDANQLQNVLLATRNLRQQAEVEAKQEKLYKPRKPDWISWADAKATRFAAIAALDAQDHSGTSNRESMLMVLEDVLIISFHTVMPPDRVGVIRMLSIEETLKKQEGSEHYYIDLTKFVHKTAKFYGPSMTPISELITPFLTRYLEATQSGFEFTDYDEEEEQHRTRRRYLFAMKSDATRCLATSHWTTRVKSAFRRYSPESKSPCPSLLRSAFITELRNSTNDPQVLGAAAIAQKHSIVMQGSDTYDLETHVRATKSAMEWCHSYATGGIEGAGAESEGPPLPPALALLGEPAGPPLPQAPALALQDTSASAGNPPKRQKVSK